MEGCEREIAAMQRFREAGARVPELRWRRGAVIAITDIGETLRSIEGKLGEAGIEHAAMAAAAQLSRIHAHGLTHGRPILRNLTWDGATIGFLDFEENPMSVMPLAAAQARDILLLLASLGRRNSRELVKSAFAAYAMTMPPGVAPELHRASRLAGAFEGRLGRYLSHRLGNRDLTGVALALGAVAGNR
jgi:tRNA A-37 threonylcarbamoyl transferase component Bud32